MNKKRAKINFCLVIVLLAIALVLCFASFKLPASNDNFNGFFNSISATSDISDGYYAEYDIKTEDASDKEISELIKQEAPGDTSPGAFLWSLMTLYDKPIFPVFVFVKFVDQTLVA